MFVFQVGAWNTGMQCAKCSGGKTWSEQDVQPQCLDSSIEFSFILCLLLMGIKVVLQKTDCPSWLAQFKPCGVCLLNKDFNPCWVCSQRGISGILLNNEWPTCFLVVPIAFTVLLLKTFVLDCMEVLCSRKPWLLHVEDIHSKTHQELSSDVTQSKAKEISDGTSNKHFLGQLFKMFS